MMGEKGLLLAGVCLAATWVILPQAWGQERPHGKEGAGDVAKPFRVREGFQGLLSLITKQGKTVPLKIAVHRWSIDGSLGRQTIHLDDFTLFQVRGGKIKMLVDGKEDVKSADAYWTMPAGANFTFEVKGETALLEAMMVSTK
jgi:hypothetical protein